MPVKYSCSSSTVFSLLPAYKELPFLWEELVHTAISHSKNYPTPLPPKYNLIIKKKPSQTHLHYYCIKYD